MQPLWNTEWNFLKKLKMELLFDPVIQVLGLYPKNPETSIQKNLCTPMFTAALFIVAKVWKLPKCPSVDEWIKIAVVNSPCLFRKNYNSFSVNEGKLFFRKSAS